MAAMAGSVVPFLALCGVFATSFAQQPQVTISLGTLKGSVQQSLSGRDLYAFHGVPYAKPPVGEHRFKQSVASGPWTGILNATRAPPSCMQLVGKFALSPPNLPFDVIGSEDCLYLNIYTPKLPSQQSGEKLLDVVVEIHGGGFQMGSGSMITPVYLLDRDVVLVTINYRLGILGFLSFEDDVVPGNNGHKDQSLALQWVNKHIAAFGGDPNKVTIAGLSSGGASVHSHMLSPMSKGLFHKAISNSGTMGNPWAIARNARKIGLQIAESIGCPTSDTKLTLKCLKERSAEQIVSAVETYVEGEDLGNPMVFVPVIEPPGPNAFMDKHPIELIKSQAGSDVPVLFSYAEDEGSLFLLKPFWSENRTEKYNENWDEMIPKAALFDGLVEPAKEKEISGRLREYFLDNKKIKENLHGYTRLFGERFFDEGIQKSSLVHAAHQSSPVYLYKFSYERPKGFLAPFDALLEEVQYKGGAIHGEDNMYTVCMFFGGSLSDFPDVKAMVKTMTDVWFKFIQENPVENWSTVDSKLPQITFLDISSSDPKKNVFKTEDTAGQKIWDSLNLPDTLGTLSKPKSSKTKNTEL